MCVLCSLLGAGRDPDRYHNFSGSLRARHSCPQPRTPEAVRGKMGEEGRAQTPLRRTGREGGLGLLPVEMAAALSLQQTKRGSAFTGRCCGWKFRNTFCTSTVRSKTLNTSPYQNPPLRPPWPGSPQLQSDLGCVSTPNPALQATGRTAALTLPSRRENTVKPQ